MVNRSNQLMTTRGVAKMLNINVNTVRRWSDAGIIKRYRIGPRGDHRYSREDLMNFLTVQNNCNSYYKHI